MSDNNLKIVFDYKKPDEAALLVYRSFGGGVFLGSEPSISVVRSLVGRKAIELYSQLSGKSIEQIEEEASK